MNVCVIIPAYNEEREIADIVRRVKRQDLDVIVVDDGSGDNTCIVAKDAGAITLSDRINRGKGASLIKGFEFAIRKKYDAVITLDGDGQHIAEEVARFIEAAQDESASLFIGNRMSDARGMPYTRWLTNKFMSWLISRIVEQRIPDSQCGYRLIRTETLKNIDLRTTKYEIDSEIIIKTAKAGYKIKSVPIKTVYQNEISQINPFKDTVRFIRYLYRELLKHG